MVKDIKLWGSKNYTVKKERKAKSESNETMPVKQCTVKDWILSLTSVLGGLQIFMNRLAYGSVAEELRLALKMKSHGC